jgi:hypothetical protein
MIKKYLPFIFLIVASLGYFYIKQHQRGDKPLPKIDEPTEEKISIPAQDPAANNNREEGFDRRTAQLTYSKHARCRMECRHIDESEVKEILEKGTVNYSKIETDARGKTYPLEGTTRDNQRVRIVFAPKEEGLVVVTCIDLDKDWPCDCK